MSQTVEVPGVGDLEFPDGMSQPDMAAAIKKNFPQIHADAPKAASWGPSSEFKPGGFFKDVAENWRSDAQATGQALKSEGRGIVDPLVGIGQAVGHVIGQGERADRFVQEREAGIAQDRASQGQSGTDGFRLMGNLMAPTNYLVPGGAGANALGRIGTSALAAGATGAMSPVTSGNYWAEKGKQAGYGALAGGGSTAVGEGIAAVLKPAFSKGVQALIDAGINLTPGQMKGGTARRAEEAAKSVPMLGTAIRNAEARAIKGFNTATIDKALEPIGAKLPQGMGAGHEAIAEGQKVLSNAYDTLLPKLQFGMDQQFGQDLTAVRSAVSEMPEAQAKQFDNILDNRVGKRLAPNGVMDGATLKQVQGELSMMSRNYKSSADAAQRDLGHALEDVNSSIRDALERQNPAQAPELRKINQAYAMFTRVENAASRRATSAGVFTPSDLLQSIKVQDRSVRKRAFAAGDGLLQDWAQNAHEILGNKLHDSGTSERAMWDIGGPAAAMMFHQPALAAGLVASTLPYSKPGMNLLREFATAMPATRNHLAQMTRQTIPQIAPAAGAIAPGLMGANQ